MEQFTFLSGLIQDGDIKKVKYFTENSLLTHEKYVSKVAKLGSNPYIKHNLVGAYPVVVAAVQGRVDILRYLISVGFNKNHFQIGPSCHVDERIFLDYGHEPGSLPIHYACREGHLNVIKCLIEECGVDVDVMFKSRETPLHSALFGMHLHIVEYLVSKGAYRGRDDTKLSLQTPLHLAVVMDCDVRIINCLASGNIHVDATDDEFLTALVYAVEHREEDVVGCLLEAGASPDGDPRGEVTPLFVAIQHKKVENARRLILAGAGTDKHWSMKSTYLDTAIMLKDYQMVHCLVVDMNVTVNRPSRQRKAKKSLDLAMYQQNLPIIQLLLSVDYSSRRNDHVFRFKCPKKTDIISDILLTYTDILSKPKSLQKICCLRIRRSMGGKLPHCVDYLPLPKPLVEYVKLNHLPKHPDDWSSRSHDIV